MGNTTLGQLLSGIFSGGYGLNQLFGSGASSVGGSAAAGAAAANPFGNQYAGYQPQLQNAITQLLGQQSGTSGQIGNIINQLMGMGQGTASTLTGLQGQTAGIGGQVANLQGQAGNLAGQVAGFNTNAGSVPTSVSGSGSDLNSQLNALAGNYMSDPAIQSEYKLGLGTVQASNAAQGLMGSGAADVALENYGQEFAAGAYNEIFNQILQQSQAAFGQNVGATQLGASLQGQTFGEQSSQAGMIGNLLGLQGQFAGQQGGLIGQQGTLAQGAEQSLLTPTTAAGGLAGTLGNLNLSSTQNLISQLLSASGATTGSPATAGSILSGQFANSQTAAGNLGAGLGGIGGAVDSLLGITPQTSSDIGSGIGGFLNSLFGGGNSGSSLTDLLSGGGGSLTSGLLSSSGFLDSLLGGGSSAVDSYLGNIATSGVDSSLGVGLGALGGLF